MKDNDSNEVGFLVNLVDWSYMTAFGGERGITIKSNPEAKELLITAPKHSLLFYIIILEILFSLKEI